MAEVKVYAHTRIAKRVLYFGAATKRPNARCLSRKEFFAFSHIHRWFVVFVCVLVKELMLLCVLLWAVEPIARIICLIWIYECLQHHGYIWNEEADMIFSALRLFFFLGKLMPLPIWDNWGGFLFVEMKGHMNGLILTNESIGTATVVLGNAIDAGATICTRR